MTFGEIVLVQYPFTTETSSKKRPALVILDPDDGDILLARVSSQPFESDYETTVSNWEKAGLRLPSWVRLHKLTTLQKSLIDKPLGKLSSDDLQTLAHVPKRLIS